MALSKIDVANMVENEMPQANIANNINFRNIIINGGMDLAQRGTSATTLALSSGGFRYNDVDRFAVNAGNISSGQVSTEQINSGLDGFPKAKRITVTTAQASPATNGYLSIVHNIEGQNLQYIKYGTSNALALTLSFYIRSSVTGNFAGNIIQTHSRPSQNRAFIFNYTINSANTWEKKTILILADNSGVINNDSTNSFEINLTYLYVGSDYSNGTLNTWNSNPSGNSYVNNATRVNLLATSGATFDITGVQLEAGTTASDFEFLPYDVNLQRCQRYYQKTFAYATKPAQNISAGNLIVNIVAGGNADSRGGYLFPVEMRAAPTITTFNPFATNSSFRKPNSSTDIAVSGETHPNFVNFAAVGSGTMSLHGHFTVEAEI